MSQPRITGTERLTAAQVTAVLAVAAAAAAADAVAPLSEHVLLHMRDDSAEDDGGARAPAREFLLTVDGETAGYAHLDLPVPGPDAGGELVVHPARRGQGLGRALVGELTVAAGGHVLRLWAHGDLPAAAGLAARTGFERFRALWQMRRPLRGRLDEPRLPAGHTLRTFVPGQDEDEWVSLNGRAFAKHPEQGAWTRHDLELREREPWFDPAGLFIAEAGGRMTGFHWTKVHQGGEPDLGGNREDRLGEVYVLGVDPAGQGSGLGRALTLAGLRYLRGLGLAEVMLYADEDNGPAIRMYEALGFTRTRTDAMYRRPPRRPRGDDPPASPGG